MLSTQKYKRFFTTAKKFEKKNYLSVIFYCDFFVFKLE